MIAFRLIALVAWVFASTLSVTASAHASGHGADHGAHAPSHHAKAASEMSGHGHHEMSMPIGDDAADCDESCCDGLCLCGAGPVPAGIEADSTALVRPALTAARYDVIAEGAVSGALAPEGPPPRSV